MQRRIKRSLLHLQCFLRRDENPLCDAITVNGALRNGLKDQKVKCALNEIGLFTAVHFLNAYLPYYSR